MACTYILAPSATAPCFLEIREMPSGDLVRQLNLSYMKWEEKSDDDITIIDDRSTFTADIDQIPAFATVADLIAFLEPLRATCQLVPAGGFPPAPPIPTTVNGSVTYTLETGIGATAAGLHGVSITNVGTSNGLVLGNTIIPGQTVTWNCYFDETTAQMRMIPAIAFDGTGTTLAINTFL